MNVQSLMEAVLRTAPTLKEAMCAHAETASHLEGTTGHVKTLMSVPLPYAAITVSIYQEDFTANVR